jgi:hypothetical protein
VTAKELDDIYDTGCLLVERERWSLIDDLLEFYTNAAWRIDVDLLLAWAIITHWCRSNLKNRERFISECIKFHSEVSLWKGLE